MMALLNPRVLIALALTAFLAFTHFSAYRAGRAAVRADFDAYKLTQSEQRLLADRAQRNEETRRQAAIDKEAANATAYIADLENEHRAAVAAADSLRDAADRARKGATAAAAVPPQPGGDPLDLLVGVLARHSGELVAVGEFADRLRIAGLACERSYDALSAAP